MSLTSLHFSSHYASLPWSIFHCSKEFLSFCLPAYSASENSAHSGRRKRWKKSKDISLTLLMDIHKKWKFSFVNVNISFKGDEIALMWPNFWTVQIYTFTLWLVLLVHKGGPIFWDLFFFLSGYFKLCQNASVFSRASRNANCAFSISILLRTKGGSWKPYTPADSSVSVERVVAMAI